MPKTARDNYAGLGANAHRPRKREKRSQIRERKAIWAPTAPVEMAPTKLDGGWEIPTAERRPHQGNLAGEMPRVCRLRRSRQRAPIASATFCHEQRGPASRGGRDTRCTSPAGRARLWHGRGHEVSQRRLTTWAGGRRCSSPPGLLRGGGEPL